MKGQLPIVIAFILLSALLMATLFYISSTTAISGIPSYGYTSMDWVRVSEELDNLVYLCLSIGSQKADEKFIEIYEDLLQSTSPGDFPEYLDQLNNAVVQASSEADAVMEKVVNWIIGNWSLLKSKTGYIVEIRDLKADYVVDFGYGYSEVYLKVLIVSPIGEYRVFTKQLKLYYALNLTEIYPGDPYFSKLYFEFKAMSYMERNGMKLYYLMPTDKTTGIIISILHRLFGVAEPETDLVGVFYYGRGRTYMLFKWETEDSLSRILNFLIWLINNFSNINAIGVTSSIEVDGIVARTALAVG